MKWLLCLVFVAWVKTPLGIDKVYRDIVSYKVDGMSIILTRENGKVVVAPALFTMIEEK